MASAASFETKTWRDFRLPEQLEAVLQFQRSEVVSLIASYALEHLQYIVRVTRRIEIIDISQKKLYPIKHHSYHAFLYGRDSRFFMVQKMESQDAEIQFTPEHFTQWHSNWKPFDETADGTRTFITTYHFLNVNVLIPNPAYQISLRAVIENGVRRNPWPDEKIDARRLPYNFFREGEKADLVEDVDSDWRTSEEYSKPLKLHVDSTVTQVDL